MKTKGMTHEATTNREGQQDEEKTHPESATGSAEQEAVNGCMHTEQGITKSSGDMVS